MRGLGRRRRLGLHDAARATLIVALVTVALADGVRAEDGPAVVERLARSSVDARFVPDPEHSDRDLVTGRARADLEQSARQYYEDLRRRDPERFERVRSRMLGSASAKELDAIAMHELAAGRPASAELAWERLVDEHPESPEAPQALLRLASSRLRAGERAAAADDLARLPELDMQLSYQAAPLVSRLLQETDADLKRRPRTPRGGDRVALHPSLQALDLDRARDLSEWTAGYSLLDEVARGLRMETSGDILRTVKRAGQDDITLDGLTGLIPLEERQRGLRTEERLRAPGDLAGADARAAERGRGKQLEKFQNLSRLQQLQVLLLQRTIEDLELEPPARRLGEAALAERRALGVRVEAVAARPPDDPALTPEQRAVGRLARLADCNGDGKLSPLRDDEGLWKRHRMAVEGDMRNAVQKPLDDDNKRRVADLFEQSGLSEHALLAALVRACSEPVAARHPGAASGLRVAPDRVERLLAALAERSAPIWAAAPHARGKALPGDAERDYLARLSVLRLPGESLDDVLVRELLSRPSAVGSGALAVHPRAGRLLAELASLGARREGAWFFEDDPPQAPARRTASQKLERAEAIRAELDDVSAGLAMDEITRVMVADLESQGMRFDPADVELIGQRIQHEDLGTLALVFDELGNFTSLDRAVVMTQPGTALGDRGPGHVAYGFGLDLMSGTPATSAGWRDSREIRDGRATLSYHVGGAGSPDGPTDSSGVSARFRRQKVWQPEVGADASILRGLAGRGFFNLIRDVTLKHERQLARVFEDHEAARAEGRAAFLDSVSAKGAGAQPAVLFTQSLGRTRADLDHDDESFGILTSSYEFEKARQKSLLNRHARRVRFAGVGFSLAFLAGDAFVLAGPMIGAKDFRLFSQLVDAPTLRVQSEEAGMRRVALSTWPRGGVVRTREARVQLHRGADAEGVARFVSSERDEQSRLARLDEPLPARATLVMAGAADGAERSGAGALSAFETSALPPASAAPPSGRPLAALPPDGVLRARPVAQAPGPRLFATLASRRPSDLDGLRGTDASRASRPSSVPEPRATDNMRMTPLDDADASSAATARGLERLSRALRASGVPLHVEAAGMANTWALEPASTTPWCAQSLDLFVAEDEGLGLELDARGRPVLIAPDGLDGVVLDAMLERRSVTRPGEADEIWRLAFSRAPGRRAIDVIENSARRLRCEVVDGRFIGAAVIATRHRTGEGDLRTQANLLAPGDREAGAAVARLRAEAAAARPQAESLLPAIALRRMDETPPDGTISDPDALSSGFLDALRKARGEDVVLFKTRGIQHASLASTGAVPPSSLEPDNVAFIQALALQEQGRRLSGRALEHAHFLLVHEGLFRGDEGSVTQQVSYLQQRAVTPFAADREMAVATDPLTRRVLDRAGVDEAAALATIGEGMRARVAEGRRAGRLDHQLVPAGTRIVTASWSGRQHGVQRTTATEPTPAHLLEPLSLNSNEGRYVAALAIGPDVPALALSMASELGGGEDAARLLEPRLADALGDALAHPASEREIVATIDGATLRLTLADPPRAGALARCKNATLFPPAYGAMLEHSTQAAVAAAPAMFVGAAESASRFVGRSWAGWRRLSLLAAAPLVAAATRGGGRGGGDDDPGGGDDGGGGDDDPPPPRDGAAPPGRGGARGGADRPDRSDKPNEPPQEEEPPRGGTTPPGRGGGRERPGGDRPEPPGDTADPPREGEQPPGHPPGGRPSPPDPGDRPRRPVD